MSSSWWVLAPSQGGGLPASLKLTPEKLEPSVRQRAIPWAPGLRLSGQNGPQQASTDERKTRKNVPVKGILLQEPEEASHK